MFDAWFVLCGVRVVSVLCWMLRVCCVLCCVVLCCVVCVVRVVRVVRVVGVVGVVGVMRMPLWVSKA